MDRDAIERRDFPTGRRGYDPAAVDEHLRRVADEFERAVHPAPPSLSSGASDQVRHILEAAERSAAELRAKAGEQAGDHVERVRGAADGLLGRLDQLEGELGNLLEALRRSGERLSEGLADLQARVGDVAEPAAGDAGPPPRADAPPTPSAAELDAQLAAPAGDDAGARLIALNMALSGTPREETARYLAEHFGLADTGALLDEVYARAGR